MCMYSCATEHDVQSVNFVEKKIMHDVYENIPCLHVTMLIKHCQDSLENKMSRIYYRLSSNIGKLY